MTNWYFGEHANQRPANGLDAWFCPTCLKVLVKEDLSLLWPYIVWYCVAS